MALKSFTNLQQVLLLQVLHEEDHEAIRMIRANVQIADHFDLSWSAACTHATRTFVRAQAQARSRLIHLSSYFFSAESALNAFESPALDQVKWQHISPPSLRRLILTFFETKDLEHSMSQIGPSVKILLQNLRLLEVLHLGFYHPLDLPLWTIIPDTTFEHLTVFGVEGWKLASREIIDFTERHSRHLRGLRLRRVMLRRDDLWTDVLLHIRMNLPMLTWLSLGRIGYAEAFDAQTQNVESGFEIPYGLDYDSEEEDDSDEDDDEPHVLPVLDRAQTDAALLALRQSLTARGHNLVHDTLDEQADHAVNSTLEDTEAAELPILPDPGTYYQRGMDMNDRDSSRQARDFPDPLLDYVASLHTLGGLPISDQQRKFWEQWCLRKTRPVDLDSISR
ncbi:arginine-tRNA ligase [Sphaceloma murrayae]|uniref:Arginine-tRNA ligase n=1 Tax=Sphaceloma murrayae TaxID=2082308 RepID=A0A2K1QH79_9PEZI|nr:arginine-tRNA ligase [Sphaceloma murrayae]